MSMSKDIVINTGPILALVAAIGSLQVIAHVVRKVHLPAIGPVRVGRDRSA